VRRYERIKLFGKRSFARNDREKTRPILSQFLRDYKRYDFFLDKKILFELEKGQTAKSLALRRPPVETRKFLV